MLSFTRFSNQKYNEYLIIAHGLFGSKKNWTSTAKFLSENLNLEVIVVDLRNHGSSFWSDNHDYLSMARDLVELCKNSSKKVTILGHSMGGKAAMYACLSYPEIFDKLIVVDISPVNYLNSEFVNYIEILQRIDLTKIQSRKDADLELESKIVDKNIRSFLLQNLFREDENNYSWKVNLEALKKNIHHIMSFPPIQNRFLGKTLFIKGENSNYINVSHHPEIKKFFPNFNLKKITKSGHWPHVEKPQLFREEIKIFFS
mgnify:FL=1